MINSQKPSARKVQLFRSDDAIVRSPGTSLAYLMAVRALLLVCLIATLGILLASQGVSTYKKFNTGFGELGLALTATEFLLSHLSIHRAHRGTVVSRGVGALITVGAILSLIVIGILASEL
jgi:hypothetical protein